MARPREAQAGLETPQGDNTGRFDRRSEGRRGGSDRYCTPVSPPRRGVPSRFHYRKARQNPYISSRVSIIQFQLKIMNTIEITEMTSAMILRTTPAVAMPEEGVPIFLAFRPRMSPMMGRGRNWQQSREIRPSTREPVALPLAGSACGPTAGG